MNLVASSLISDINIVLQIVCISILKGICINLEFTFLLSNHCLLGVDAKLHPTVISEVGRKKNELALLIYEMEFCVE